MIKKVIFIIYIFLLVRILYAFDQPFHSWSSSHTLTSSFCERRGSSEFHGGVDIKGNKKEVYAVENGTISRKGNSSLDIESSSGRKVQYVHLGNFLNLKKGTQYRKTDGTIGKLLHDHEIDVDDKITDAVTMIEAIDATATKFKIPRHNTNLYFAKTNTNHLHLGVEESGKLENPLFNLQYWTDGTAPEIKKVGISAKDSSSGVEKHDDNTLTVNDSITDGGNKSAKITDPPTTITIDPNLKVWGKIKSYLKAHDKIGTKVAAPYDVKFYIKPKNGTEDLFYHIQMDKVTKASTQHFYRGKDANKVYCLDSSSPYNSSGNSTGSWFELWKDGGYITDVHKVHKEDGTWNTKVTKDNAEDAKCPDGNSATDPNKKPKYPDGEYELKYVAQDLKPPSGSGTTSAGSLDSNAKKEGYVKAVVDNYRPCIRKVEIKV